MDLACATLLAKQSAKLATKVSGNTYELGRVLYGALQNVQVGQKLTLDGTVQLIAPEISLELGDALATSLISQSSLPQSSRVQLAWQRGIPNLYQELRGYPSEAFEIMNDAAEEQGLDHGLWESVIQNLELSQWPSVAKTADPAKYLAATDSNRALLVGTAKDIRQGLGFLSLSKNQIPSAIDARLKAQYISQVVVGRFGTRAWNAAGKLVMRAIPSNEHVEVLRALKQPPAEDHGFFATYDNASGEWGMQDPQTRLIWFNATATLLDWEEAEAYCRHKKQFLPSWNQWEEVAHVIHQVFPEIRILVDGNEKWFWSSTPDGFNHVHAFNGREGAVYGAFRRKEINETVFARCVSAARDLD